MRNYYGKSVMVAALLYINDPHGIEAQSSSKHTQTANNETHSTT